MDAEKFDYAISNPPYQETWMSPGSNNPNTRDIYYHFQESAFTYSRNTVMIYPSRRWLQLAGKNSKEFGKRMLSNPGLVAVDHFDSSLDLFPNIDICDGVSIVLWSDETDNKGVFTLNGHPADVPEPGKILVLDHRIRDLLKTVSERGLPSISSRKVSRSVFGVESDHEKYFPGSLIPVSQKSPFTKSLSIFTIGRKRNPEWLWIDDASVKRGRDKIGKWKIIISSARPIRDYHVSRLVLAPDEIYGRSRAAMAMFDTEEEARNFYAYSESKFFEALFKVSSDGLTNMGAFVPDLGDYTASNPDIDWDQPLDDQLYALFKLSDEEIKVING